MADLKTLGIYETLEEIKKITKKQFRNQINKKIRENAFDYLKS